MCRKALGMHMKLLLISFSDLLSVPTIGLGINVRIVISACRLLKQYLTRMRMLCERISNLCL